MGVFNIRQVAIIAALVLPLMSSVYGFEPRPQLAKNPAYSLATNALRDGLFQVAAQNFRSLLQNEDIAEESRRHLVAALVESQVRAGDGSAALVVLQESGELLGDALPFWKGTAEGIAGKTTEAVETLSKVSKKSNYATEAALTRSSLLQALGRDKEALLELQNVAAEDVSNRPPEASLRLAELQLAMGNREEAALTLGGLGKLSSGEAAARDYLLARIEMERGDYAAARSRLEPLAASRNGVEQGLNHGIRLALADAYIGAEQPEKAVTLLDALVSEPGGSPLLGLAFQRMTTIGMLEGEVGADRLAAWSGEDMPERATHASYHLAKRKIASGQNVDAIAALETFTEEHSGHSLAEKALLELAELHALESRPSEALAAINRLGDVPRSKGDLIARRKFVEAMALYAKGESEAAAEAFQAAATGASDQENAVISAMNAGLANLGNESTDPPLIMTGQISPERRLLVSADLELNRGIFEAKRGNPSASTTLQAFLEKNPDHVRAAEAELVIAELALLQDPPEIEQAAAFIRSSRARGLQPIEEERAAYIEVWLAAYEEEAGGFITASYAFLENWPDSEFTDDVRMRLAEEFYQAQDYPNAQTQFEILAGETPDSPHAEAALFFAGRAAMSLLSPEGITGAVDIWGKLVDRDATIPRDAENPAPHSTFSLYARYYQAVAKRRLGNYDESLVALEGLLALEPPPPADLAIEARFATGEVYMLLGSTEPDNYQKAASVFEKITEGDDAAAKYRAGYLLGACYEKMGEKEKALAASYAPVGDSSAEINDPSILLWIYRSGFRAVSLLAEQEEWEAAVKVAERMARTSGERSEEARLLAEKLRLEHFIWEEE